MRRGERLLTLLLIVTTAGFSYALYRALDTPKPLTTLPTPEQPAEPLQPAQTGASTEQAAPQRVIGDFTEMVKRPLFSPSRRPLSADDQPTVSEPDTPRAPAEKSQLSVMGILITGETKIALLKQRDKEADILHVKEGQLLTGSRWKVTEITPGTVRLQQGSGSELLKLSDNMLSAADKRRLQQLAKQQQLKATKLRQRKNRQKAVQLNRKRKTNIRKRATTPRRIAPRTSTRATAENRRIIKTQDR